MRGWRGRVLANSVNRSVWIISMSLFWTSAVVAQRPAPGTAIGDYVRFRVSEVPSDTLGISCEARISRLLLDTLVVKPVGRCARLTSGVLTIHGLQLEKKFASRPANIAVFATLGAITGSVAGLLIVGDGCRKGGCDDGALAVAQFTMTGAVLGGLIGTAVGYFRPTGSRWVSSADRAIRFDR